MSSRSKRRGFWSSRIKYRTFRRKNIFSHTKVHIHLYRHGDEEGNRAKVDADIEIKDRFDKVKKIIRDLTLKKAEISPPFIEE